MTNRLETIMKKVSCIAWGAFVCLGLAANSQSAVFDVYIAAGQSNMDGRGDSSHLVDALAPYAAPQRHALIHYTNPGRENGTGAYQTSWSPLGPGYSIPPNYSGSLPSTRFGPELSFGKFMSEQTSDRQVAIIKVSRGGTNLHTQWDPSDTPDDPQGHMYAGFAQAVPLAIQALQAQGHSVEIRGMIWHQGESDGGGTSDATRVRYEENLTELIQFVRQDLGYPNLPFLIGELESVDGGREAVRSAQANVAAALDFVEFVPSAGLQVSDGTHFTSASVIEFGERFAAKMLQTTSQLPGDFNRDGRVDESDYQVWKAHFGSTTLAQADANNDGIVDSADYTVWRNNLGSTSPPPPPATVKFDLLTAAPFGQAGNNIGGAITGVDEQGAPHSLVLTSADVQVPNYVEVPGNPTHRTWDGTTYVVGRTRVSSSLGLGIDNPTIDTTHIGSESQNFDAKESWTITFDQDVVFKQIEFTSFHAEDTAKVEVGELMTVELVGGSGMNLRNDPFGDLLIPAHTPITFTNAADPILSITDTVTNLPLWRIKSFTVVAYGSSVPPPVTTAPVPEP